MNELAIHNRSPDRDLLKELNEILKQENLPYKISIEESTMVLCERYGMGNNDHYFVISRLVLLPTEAICLLYHDKPQQAKISMTTFQQGQFLNAILLKYSEIGDLSVLYNTWGITQIPVLDKATADIVKEVLFAISQHITTRNIYCYVGWNENNDSYIYGNLMISKKEMIPIKSQVLKRTIAFPNLGEAEVLTFLRDCYFSVTKDQTNAITIFIYNILGLLYPKMLYCCSMVPSFGLANIGPTGTGKTTSTMAMVNPLDLPMGSFEDTEKALIQSVKERHCGCFVIDDLNVDDVEKTSKLEAILRLMGDKTTQSNKVVGGKVSNSVAQNLCIFTGEKLPNLQPSSIPRVLVLKYAKDTIVFPKLSELSDNSGKVIATYAFWLQIFIRNCDIENDIVAKVKARRGKIQEEYGNNQIYGRYIDMVSWLMTMWEYVVDRFQKLNVEFDFDYASNIKKIVHNQFLTNQCMPIPMFIHSITEMLDQNLISIGEESDFRNCAELDIVDDGDRWFVVSGVLYNKICSFCEKVHGKTFPISEKQLRDELGQCGLIQTFNGNTKYTTELRKGNKRKSGYYLFINLLKNYNLGGFYYENDGRN